MSLELSKAIQVLKEAIDYANAKLDKTIGDNESCLSDSLRKVDKFREEVSKEIELAKERKPGFVRPPANP